MTEFEIRERLQAMLAGDETPNAFREWLWTAAWSLPEDDPAAWVTARIKRVYSEFDRGDLDEAELQVALKSIAMRIDDPYRSDATPDATNTTSWLDTSYRVTATSMA